MTPFLWFMNMTFYSYWLAVLNGSLSRRRSAALTWGAEFLGIALMHFLAEQFPYLSVLRSATVVILLILCFILYKDPWQKILFTYVLVLLTAYLHELTFFTVFNPSSLEKLLAETGSPSYYYFHLFYLAMGAVSFFLLHLFLNHWRYRLGVRESLLFAGFPLSQIVLIFSWLRVMNAMELELRFPYFLGVAGVCLLADIGLFVAIVYISQRRQLLRENEQLADMVSSQESHYEELARQYSSVRRMRHDIDNQLHAMEGLIAGGQNEEAAAYLRELRAYMEKGRRSVCENLVADAFLRGRCAAAEEKGLRIETAVSLRASLPLSPVDLIRAFGNLLDNAAEAAAEFPGAVIRLQAAESRGCLVIRCENPCQPEKKTKGRRIPELERGLGSTVLAALAEKYSGSYEGEQEDGHYRAELILQLPPEPVPAPEIA